MKANGVDDSANIRTYVYIESERSHVGFMSGGQKCIPDKPSQIILNVFYELPVTSDLSPVALFCLFLALTFRYIWALRSPKAIVISKWWTFDSAQKSAALLY